MHGMRMRCACPLPLMASKALIFLLSSCLLMATRLHRLCAYWLGVSPRTFYQVQFPPCRSYAEGLLPLGMASSPSRDDHVRQPAHAALIQPGLVGPSESHTRMHSSRHTWLLNMTGSGVLQFYTIAAVLLFTARFITYHKKRWHYYFLVSAHAP